MDNFSPNMPATKAVEKLDPYAEAGMRVSLLFQALTVAQKMGAEGAPPGAATLISDPKLL